MSTPYDPAAKVDALPHWATEPRDDLGRFDFHRDWWGRPIIWVDAETLADDW